MASSASESPAVQRAPAALRMHSLSQGMLWAETQPSGTSLSGQRLPHAFCKSAWLVRGVQQCCLDICWRSCCVPAQAMDSCEVQGCFTLRLVQHMLRVHTWTTQRQILSSWPCKCYDRKPEGAELADPEQREEGLCSFSLIKRCITGAATARQGTSTYASVRRHSLCFKDLTTQTAKEKGTIPFNC